MDSPRSLRRVAPSGKHSDDLCVGEETLKIYCPVTYTRTMVCTNRVNRNISRFDSRSFDSTLTP